MEDNKKSNEQKEAEVIHQGSTTQGGSNFGQGQTSLGNQQQGTEKSRGSDYENEQGWNNEALKMDDIPPAIKETDEHESETSK